jgi:hypothetical protein
MSTDRASPGGSDDPPQVAELEAAAEAVEAAEQRVAEFGEDALEALRGALGEFTTVLDRYEDSATGDGNFQEFIEFQGTVADIVAALPEDLLLRETFEEADERLQQRRLSESDFERVRADLEPVADLAGRLDERREARERYRSARSGVRHRLQEVRERIDELERITRLGDADLDAPVERLREPIETYNEAVTEAFRTYRRDAPARSVLSTIEAAQRFPLVPFRRPPPELVEYVDAAETGTEPIPRLLEYAEYSRSKLAHYVTDPGALKTAVRPHTTYLRRLDATPLTVDWPPPSADLCQWRCLEIGRVLNRFAPDVVSALRAVRDLPRSTDYERLRETATATAELGPAERERLRSGEVAAELESLRAERAALEETLETYPAR